MIDRVFVWALPVRAFHWLIAALVVFSYVAGKVGGGWMEWHLRSGYAIFALLLFRIAWGLTGGTSARFTHFLRGPRAAIAYVAELRAGRRPLLASHNPLGGWMVMFLLAILVAQVATGLFADDEIATQGPLAARVSSETVARMSAWHAWNSWIIVGGVAFHVATILFYQWKLGIDLIRPMIHGWKAVDDGALAEPLRPASLMRAIVVMVLCAAAVYAIVIVYPRNG